MSCRFKQFLIGSLSRSVLFVFENFCNLLKLFFDVDGVLNDSTSLLRMTSKDRKLSGTSSGVSHTSGSRSSLVFEVLFFLLENGMSIPSCHFFPRMIVRKPHEVSREENFWKLQWYFSH